MQAICLHSTGKDKHVLLLNSKFYTNKNSWSNSIVLNKTFDFGNVSYQCYDGISPQKNSYSNSENIGIKGGEKRVRKSQSSEPTKRFYFENAVCPNSVPSLLN